MPRSYAWRTSLVKPSWPSSRCTWPPILPVPKASRVTLTFDLPSVTQSVADWLPTASERGPVSASAPAAAVVVFRNWRREWRDIGHLELGADQKMVVRRWRNGQRGNDGRCTGRRALP